MKKVKQCLVAINLKQALTFKKPSDLLLPLEVAYVCMEEEDSCRNCCPSNSKAGNPLPGGAPLHKSTHVQSPRDGDQPGNQAKC